MIKNNLKRFSKKIFILILYLLPPRCSCLINNLRQKIFKRNTYFNYDNKLNLFYAYDQKNKMYFPDKIRGIQTYSYGIGYRANQLIKTYSFDLINFKNYDLVIDCGANYGDVYRWFKINNIKINYISFEPSPREYECIKLNCINQKNYNLALSNKESSMNFFLKTDTGDSSLIEPSTGFTNKIMVNTTTVENFLNKKNINKVKLFKVEAEGFEPEILEGAKSVLSRIEYIGVDGSPERGKNNESTIEYVTEFLLKNNFKIIFENINEDYAKSLFQNKNTKT